MGGLSGGTTNRLATMESLYERFAAGDFAASLPLLDPGVVLVVDAGIPDGGMYAGVDGVRDYMTRFLQPWDTMTIAKRSLREAGDTVLAEVDQHGVGRSSQASADMRYFQSWTFRGSKVVHIEVFLDEARALEAVAL